MGTYDDRPYAVGKGKPPPEHQFKKGQSGNPRGPRRKKKAQDATLEVLAHEAVNELVRVVIGGREKWMSKKEAIVHGVVNDGIAGTPAQRVKAIKLLQQIGAFDPAVEDHRLTPEMEQKRMNQIVAQLIEEGKRDESTRALFAEYK